MWRPPILVAAGCVALSLLAAPPAHARSADTAALQVALRAMHVYHGGIDGLAGPSTRLGVRRFQRRHHLASDGIAGPRTRRAMGRRGHPRLGSRAIRLGARGWDVAAVQFLLARRGSPPGGIDGGYGPGTRAAVMRFQRRAGLHADGVAGPATIRTLRSDFRRAGPVRGGSVGGTVQFLRPVRGPIGDGFGMRWGRPHQGVDFPVPYGTRVGAAGRGTTIFAGFNNGGYGNLVIIRHRLGFQTWYAHLARITTFPGEAVVGGTRIGYVGSTGHSTGPHLHFEVRLNGVPIDPMPRLLGATASRLLRSPFPSTSRSGSHRGCDHATLQRRDVAPAAANAC